MRNYIKYLLFLFPLLCACESESYQAVGGIYEAETLLIKDYNRVDPLFNANKSLGMSPIHRIYFYKHHKKVSIYSAAGFASSSFKVYTYDNLVDRSTEGPNGKMIYDFEFDTYEGEKQLEHYKVYVNMDNEYTIEVDGKVQYDRSVTRSNSLGSVTADKGHPCVYEETMPMASEE